MFTKQEFVDATLRFPLSETALKVALDAGRRLIALLGRLGEQLHDNCRDHTRNTVHLLAWWCRLSCNMTVHPLHRTRRGKWKNPGEHFVECDAQTVQIA